MTDPKTWRDLLELFGIGIDDNLPAELGSLVRKQLRQTAEEKVMELCGVVFRQRTFRGVVFRDPP